MSNTNDLLGGKVSTGLYSDESAFAKKGEQIHRTKPGLAQEIIVHARGTRADRCF